MPARHEMMKIKSTFSKVHGSGITLDIHFPNIEKMGTNLTIDIILQNVLSHLEDNNLKNLNNVYIQVDNVNSNKGLLIFGVCAALILTGIVRKFKLSYLLVGHSHDDIDGSIGTVATVLRPEDVYSILHIKSIVNETLKNLQVKHFRINIGTINYESLKVLINEAFSPNHNIAVAKMRLVLKLLFIADSNY
jgi:hypothetical protein